jgi:hypothetical protein
MNKYEVILSKGHLDLWKVSNATEEVYRITDDGSGYCNSIEEMCAYYNGDEIGLVNIIIENGNDVMFVNIETLENCTYEEYVTQFEMTEDPLIFPYVNFETYEKAKEIWDLLQY